MSQFDPTKYLRDVPTDIHEARAWAQGCKAAGNIISEALNTAAGQMLSDLPGSVGTALNRVLTAQADAVTTFADYIAEAALSGGGSGGVPRGRQTAQL